MCAGDVLNPKARMSYTTLASMSTALAITFANTLPTEAKSKHVTFAIARLVRVASSSTTTQHEQQMRTSK